MMGGAWNLKVLVVIGICVYCFLPPEVNAHGTDLFYEGFIEVVVL